MKKRFTIRQTEKRIVHNSLALDKRREENKVMEAAKEFEDFFTTVQRQYLDGILEYIGNDEEKLKCAIDIMGKIIWYNGKRVKIEEIINLVISCEEKLVLSINGLQGTGKSTFLSLLYYKMMKKVEDTNHFPILIDLHYFEEYAKEKAKKILHNHLKRIDDLIKNHPRIKFFLIFDGADEYIRKTSELENILYNYVLSHNTGNFAFCIGSAEKLPNEMIKDGKLQNISRKAIYKVEAHRIKKSNDEDISYIIKNLCIVYNFHVEETIIQVIKKAINVYTINKIDYRTLLIVLRIFNAISIDDRETQLGNYFYEYWSYVKI